MVLYIAKEENKIRDIERQRIIESDGIKVIRFTNDEIMNQLERVLKIINNHINA